jgi:hypothetical protein
MESSFTVCLEKKKKETGLEYDLISAVKFAPDISGSMDWLYKNGKVQNVLERLFVVALGLDDDKSMQVFPFSSKCEMLNTEVGLKNYNGFVDNYMLKNKKSYYFCGTSYLSMLNQIESDFEQNNKKGFFAKSKSKMPSLVLGIVDGDTMSYNKVERKILELSEKPIFFIFFGIGDDNFNFLKKLEEMNNRKIDNVAFYDVNSIDSLSDKQLYDMIAEQFVDWFYLMKKLRKI